jgi:hypothetical protein
MLLPVRVNRWRENTRLIVGLVVGRQRGPRARNLVNLGVVNLGIVGRTWRV